MVDDYNAHELAPLRQCFMDGACLLFGHTFLEQHGQLGYCSNWANDQFRNRHEKNLFYTTAGKIIKNHKQARSLFAELPSDLTPRQLLAVIKEDN